MESAGLIGGWQEGAVDRRGRHCELTYEPNVHVRGSSREQIPVALVSPPSDGVVSVEFLLDRSDPLFDVTKREVVRGIEFLIGERGVDGPDDWARVLRHCGSLANAYGPLRWNALPPEADRLTWALLYTLADPPAVDRSSLLVVDLKSNRDWPWGWGYGVYCFVRGNETVYVGRAVGKTLGERIDAHLHRTEPAWLEVLGDPEARVEVFGFDKERRFLAAALEVYLIEKLVQHPTLNRTLV